MNFYLTSDSKRQVAESIKDLHPNTAGRWLGAAACQDAGTEGAYRAAHDAWKASEPHPKDFAPERERLAIEAQIAEWLAEAEAEMDAIWGRSRKDG